MMHAVQDDTHTLPRRDEGCDADEPAKEWKHTPWAACKAECNEQVSDQAAQDTSNAETTSEDNAWPIAVADGPSDEVGVRLTAKRVLNRVGNNSESRRMGCVLQGVEYSCTLTAGQIQLTWAVLSNVYADDTVDLVAVWLRGNWVKSVTSGRCESLDGFLHGFHFMPASSNA